MKGLYFVSWLSPSPNLRRYALGVSRCGMTSSNWFLRCRQSELLKRRRRRKQKWRKRRYTFREALSDRGSRPTTTKSCIWKLRVNPIKVGLTAPKHGVVHRYLPACETTAGWAPLAEREASLGLASTGMRPVDSRVNQLQRTFRDCLSV